MQGNRWFPREARRRGAGDEDGWAMVVSVFAVFVAASAASLMFMEAATGDRIARVQRRTTEAEYLAEGAVEEVKKNLQSTIANWQDPPTSSTVTIGGVDVAYTITPTGFSNVETEASGIQTIVEAYAISATAESQGLQATVHRIVEARATPLFQFAVFYTEDLEVNPGPNMTLGGRVHTNGDMYLGSGATLTLDTNYVHAAGEIHRSRKDDPSQSTGNVQVRRWVSNPFDPSEPKEFVALNSKSQMLTEGVKTTSGYDSEFTSGWDADGDGLFDGPDDWLPWTLGALEYWKEPDGYPDGSGSTVLSGEHGIREAVTPGIESIQAFQAKSGGDYVLDSSSGEYVSVAPGTGTHAKGFFHATADLSLTLHKSGKWTAENASGLDVTSFLTGVVTVKSFYDARQGGNVQVLQVDMAKLNASGQFPENGLLYTGAYGLGSGTSLKGVKLVNGSKLNAPLTVVTEGAAYVQGDYNTTGKKGCAVIADAVNLLSNAWSDGKKKGQLPNASKTTYNLAFVTGNHDTVGSTYNGGLENLPRFHENWSGVDCVLTGSFVNGWLSAVATGAWKYGGDRYTAPNRKWSYDTAFNDIDALPPFTPMAVSAEDVAVW